MEFPEYLAILAGGMEQGSKFLGWRSILRPVSGNVENNFDGPLSFSIQGIPRKLIAQRKKAILIKSAIYIFVKFNFILVTLLEHIAAPQT